MRNYLCFLLFVFVTLFAQAQDTPTSSTKEDNKIYQTVENLPEFPGGPEALVKNIYTNLNYPQAAQDAGTEGTVILSFVVEKDGAIGDVTIRKDIGNGCGEAAIKTIKALPNWKPGMQDGKTVRVNYNIPIKFQLDALNPKEIDESERLHRRVEHSPTFGESGTALNQYIEENLIMPKDAIANNTNGFVTIEFEVNKDGSLSNINIKRDLENGCGTAAKQLIENMPNWNPGYNEKGTPLRVYYTVAIEFDQKKYKKSNK